MSFDDDLQAQASAENEYEDVDITLNGKLHTLRFLQWSGIEWAAEADLHPARPGVIIDNQYGYNIRTLCLATAKVTGRLIDGDQLLELEPEKWDLIFKQTPGAHVQRMCDAIWVLNEHRPGKEIDAARKAANASAGA